MWESGDIASESGVVDFVNENAKEGGSFVVWVGLKLRLKLDNERRRVVFRSSSCFFKTYSSRRLVSEP